MSGFPAPGLAPLSTAAAYTMAALLALSVVVTVLAAI
jgi:hypothetical protein